MRRALRFGLPIGATALALGFACCSGSDSSPAVGSAGASAGSAAAGQAASGGAMAGGYGGGSDSGGSSGSSGRAGTNASGSGGSAGADVGGSSDGWWTDSRTTWTLLPWQPSGCQLEVAKDPVQVAPPLTWKPCPGGAAGCTLFEPTLPPEPDNQQPGAASVNATVTRTASGYRLALALFYYVDKGGTQEIINSVVLYSESGNAQAVVRSPAKGCRLQLPLIAGDQTCLEFADTRQSPVNAAYACGTRTTPVTMPQPTFSIRSPFWTFFSGQILAMDPNGERWMDVYDLAAKQLYTVFSPVAQHAVYAQSASGSYALASARTDFYHVVGLLWKRPDQSVVLVDPRPDESVIDFRTDGKTLVWMTGVAPFDAQGNYATAYMYTAPFTDDPTALKPTRVRTFQSGMPLFVDHGIANQGYYVFRQRVGKLDLFRISDGHHWTINPPDGLGVTKPMEVDTQNVAYWVGPPGVGQPWGLVMQRIDALGTGD